MLIEKNKLDIQLKKITYHEQVRKCLSDVEVRKLEKGFISDVLSKDLPIFNKYRAIIISTQPGTGKTTFSEETIVKFASLRKKGIVIIVSNRVAQDIAIKKRIAKALGIYEDYNDAAIHQMSNFGNIMFLTYQQLKAMIRNGTINDKGIAFVILDEAHYFTSDATFSKDNGWLLSQIPKIFSNTIRIYITATVKEVLPYITQSECNPFASHRWKNRWLQDSYYNKIYNGIADISEQERDEVLLDNQFASNRPIPILYEQPSDFSHIKLKFYSSDDEIEKTLSEIDHKAIIFVGTKERGQELHEKFTDSEYMDAGTKVCNPELIGELTNDEAFKKKFLITTSVFENGCNIKDNEVKTVVIEHIDPVSIVQMAGRRRKCYPTDTFTLYLKIPTLEHLRQLRYLANEILHLIYGSEEQTNGFMRELIIPTVSKKLENIISVDNEKYTFDWLTKAVLKDEIKYYDELIECISEHGTEGYCSKIAKECFEKEVCESMLPKTSETTKNELLMWLDNYDSKIFNEEEFKKFVAEFKSKYISVFGPSNSDNRGKQRQEVGHTWFNNRMKTLGFPYELAVLSDKCYLLVKRELAKA